MIETAKNIRAIISIMKKEGYVIYDKPFQLNIVGIRSKTTIPNKFDDLIYVFWKNNKNEWEWKGPHYQSKTCFQVHIFNFTQIYEYFII
jgi:hypothetical protein